MNKLIKKSYKLIISLLFGGFILYWVYRDFDFNRVSNVFFHGLNWWWMCFSLLFGVFSHVFRGLRWRQTLEPLGVFPKRSDCINAIFVSYAANLVVPRLGEISRCGVLSKNDQVPFSKSLGTVVTERIIDTFCMLTITGFTLLLQMPVFTRFFMQTGTKMSSINHLLTTVWFYIALLCIIGIFVLLFYLMRTVSFYPKMKGTMHNVMEGINSLKKVRRKPLFAFYTLLIWTCYFFHFYFTFYCFSFTSSLGLLAGLVMFVGGTFAVIVPTPNGAGPWHFAVITMMMLYGVNSTDAGIFALIVHGIQTFLVALLGVYGLIALSLTNRSINKI